MSESKNRLLSQHLADNKEVLLKFSKLITNAEHNVNTGSAREALIANFLSQNLPDFVQYHTGEIFDSFDEHSGQVDIILHPISSPKLNLFGSINLFPFETVLAAIEIKTIITTGSMAPSNSYMLSDDVLSKLELETKLKDKLKSHMNIEPLEKVEFKKLVKSLIGEKIEKSVLANIVTLSKKDGGSTSTLLGALSSSEKIKRLTHYSLDNISVDKQIPFIIFGFRASDNIDLIPQKIEEWIELKSKQKNIAKVMAYRYLPDLIVILDQDFCYEKSPHWMNAGFQPKDLYNVSQANVLFEFFSYLIKLIERWSENPKSHFFPAKYYMQDMNSGNKFF